MGFLYTYLGLVLFLTGVNVGFMAAGNFLGSQHRRRLDCNWVLIPIGMLIGYFIVKAEPAVHVLNKQVEEITAGSISQQGHEPGPVHRRGGVAGPGHDAGADRASPSCGSWCRAMPLRLAHVLLRAARSSPPSPSTPAAWPPAP